MQPRVAHVRDAAIAGDSAIVRGYSAWFISRALEGLPGGLAALLARSGVPPERRADVLRTHAALGHVGALWRLEYAASTSGSADGEGSSAALASVAHVGFGVHKLFTSREAASLLGLTDRRVRSLAPSLGGRRDAGGRWLFAPDVIEAERQRRMTEAA